MERVDVFSIDELLKMNDFLLGRGAPVQHDGAGYNKADYGACATYYNGLSDAQIADLAKRLVKYSNTQLHIDRDLMQETANYYASLVDDSKDRSNGVSVDVTEDGTKISFRYNETFIEAVKAQPKRQFDNESKQWVVPNDMVIPTLNALQAVGADVDNALEYVINHELIKKVQEKKTDVLMVIEEDDVLVKFDYDQNIVDEIRKIDRKARTWNPQHKYWTINKGHFKPFMEALKHIANFKAVKRG